ncbi:MAG TPA: rhomboid family intramembrane serine protease [bacterium]|nr:rhomboid family intramembrane serine protease [bacterium]HNH33262.1 rhomboid family intramembrane serine protease [bacterium]HNO10974.1 rhomboid family intramembrane serine protease [bacterium]
MFPIRDTIPSSRFPLVTTVLIVINSLIFLYEVSLGEQLNRLINALGIIPAKYFWQGEFGRANFIERFFPFFTSMFLHGGWMHAIGNMWYLWIFGDNVEDRMGRGRFLLFYLLCGLGAGLSHAYLNADSRIPTIGASGAIAGVMGAYIVLFPNSRVLTLVPIFIFIQFFEIPAIFFLGFWVILQFLQGTASLMSDASGGVAWWAHLGGFVFGAILVFVFRQPERRRWYDEEYE